MSVIQPFEITDLYDLNNVNLDVLTENYPLEFYLEYLILWPNLFFKGCLPENMHATPESNASLLNRNCGYMMAKTEGKGHEWHAHITAVTVAPEFRRVSMAMDLCSTLEAITNGIPYEVNFVDLFVKCNNSLAIDLYKKLGYSVYRRVVGYYNSQDDGYPLSLKKIHDDKDAFDMRKAMKRDGGKSIRSDGEKHKCYPHEVRF